MKSTIEKPLKFGFISTMTKHQTTLIPWKKRNGAYVAARRFDRVITIRRVDNNKALVICLDGWQDWEQE